MYSSVLEFKQNCKLLTTQNGLTDAEIEAIINKADIIVDIDLSSIIKPVDLNGITPTPDIVNKLSQYKAVEIGLRSNMFIGYAEEDSSSNNNPASFKALYDKLLNKVLNGYLRVDWEGAYQSLAYTEVAFDFPSIIENYPKDNEESVDED